MTSEKKNKSIKQHILNFWRGDISLTISFWFVFMIGGSIVTIPSFVITDAYVDSLNNSSMILLLLFYIFQYTYLLIAYVGTWRASSKYKPKKENWAWGTIAKVYIVLNILRAISGYIL